METYIRKDDIESYIQECREDGETDLRSVLYSLDSCDTISIDIPVKYTHFIPNEDRPHELMCCNCDFSIFPDEINEEFTSIWKYCPCCGHEIIWEDKDEL